MQGPKEWQWDPFRHASPATGLVQGATVEYRKVAHLSKELLFAKGPIFHDLHLGCSSTCPNDSSVLFIAAG